MATDFTLTVGLDTDVSYENLKRDIESVIARLNAEPFKISVDLDKAQLDGMIDGLKHVKDCIGEINTAQTSGGLQNFLNVDFSSITSGISEMSQKLDTISNNISFENIKEQAVGAADTIAGLKTTVADLAAAMQGFRGVSFDVKLGGGNSVSNNARYGSAARQSIAEMQSQVEQLENAFAKATGASDGFAAAANAIRDAGKIGQLFEIKDDLGNKNASLVKRMDAYKEYINLLKEAAKVKGIDLSGVTDSFGKSADQMVEDTLKIKDGTSQVEEGYDKLQKLFGSQISSEAIESIISKLDSGFASITSSMDSLVDDGTRLNTIVSAINEVTTAVNMLVESLRNISNVTLGGFSEGVLEQLSSLKDNLSLDGLPSGLQNIVDLLDAIGKSPAALKSLSHVNIKDILDVDSINEALNAQKKLEKSAEKTSKSKQETPAFSIKDDAAGLRDAEKQYNNLIGRIDEYESKIKGWTSDGTSLAALTNIGGASEKIEENIAGAERLAESVQDLTVAEQNLGDQSSANAVLAEQSELLREVSQSAQDVTDSVQQAAAIPATHSDLDLESLDEIDEIDFDSDDYPGMDMSDFNDGIRESKVEMEGFDDIVADANEGLLEFKSSAQIYNEGGLAESGLAYDFLALLNGVGELDERFLSLRTVIDASDSSLKSFDEDTLSILKNMGLVGENGERAFTKISEGWENKGVALTDKFAIIARYEDYFDDKNGFVTLTNGAKNYYEQLILLENKAKAAGISIARSLGTTGVDTRNGLLYEIQELGSGNALHKMTGNISPVETYLQECSTIAGATDEQINKLWADIQKLTSMGFDLDLTSGNILYDQANGFTLIDLALRELGDDIPTTQSLFEGMLRALSGNAELGKFGEIVSSKSNLLGDDAKQYVSGMETVVSRLRDVFSQQGDIGYFDQITSRLSDVREALGITADVDISGDAKKQLEDEISTLERLKAKANEAYEALQRMSGADRAAFGFANYKAALENVEAQMGRVTDAADRMDRAVSAKANKAQTLINQIEKTMLSMEKYEGGSSDGSYTELQNLKNQTITAKNEYVQTGDLTAYQATLDRLTSSYNVCKGAADKYAQTHQTVAQATKAAEAAAKAAANATKDEVTSTKDATIQYGNYNAGVKAAGQVLHTWTAALKSNDPVVKQAVDNIKKYDEQLRALKQRLDDTKGDTLSAGEKPLSNADFNAETKDLNQKVKESRQVLIDAGVATKSLGDRVKGLAQKFSMWFGTSQIIMRVVRSVKELISASIELDDSMTQLKIVTKEADYVYEEFGNSISKTAQQIGAAVTDLIDATTTYARLGYNLEDSATLSKYTTMLQQVGDIDSADAQDALTSIVKAFEVDVDEIESVMDKLVAVGNGAPVSVSEIAEGMTNAGSTLSAAGNSFEESVALLTAANTQLQDISKASTGLRTITARLRNTETELDALGETMTSAEYDSLVQSLTQLELADGTKVSVSLTDANGELRNTYDILTEIANVWDQMSSNNQAALAETLAGKLLPARTEMCA